MIRMQSILIFVLQLYRKQDIGTAFSELAASISVYSFQFCHATGSSLYVTEKPFCNIQTDETQQNSLQLFCSICWATLIVDNQIFTWSWKKKLHAVKDYNVSFLKDLVWFGSFLTPVQISLKLHCFCFCCLSYPLSKWNNTKIL